MNNLDIRQILEAKDSKLTTFLNPYSYLLMRKNSDLLKSFSVKVDGASLVLFLKFINIKVHRESFDMTSLAPVIFSNSEKSGETIFFIGSEKGIVEQAISQYKQAYPKLNVIGARHGFFSSKEEREQSIKKIVLLNPSLVIVGMGTPYQEQFLIDLQQNGWNGKGFTCGGFFHQTAKKGIQYYPVFFDRFNLRWLYRILDEPKLLKRYFFHYPLFVLTFLYDYFSKK